MVKIPQRRPGSVTFRAFFNELGGSAGLVAGDRFGAGLRGVQFPLPPPPSPFHQERAPRNILLSPASKTR